MFNRKWMSRVAICMLAISILLSGVTMPAASTESLPQSTAPDTNHCVLYNYSRDDTNLTPTLYMWNVSDTATYRVYANRWATDAIGSANGQTQNLNCIIPLDAEKLSEGSGTVYVTRQMAGESESSRVSVRYSSAATPCLAFDVTEASASAQSGGAVSLTQGPSVWQPSALVEGRYYVVNVSMNNFTKVQNLALPIKYDPEILELVKLTPANENGNVIYRFDGAAASTEAGDLIQFMTPSSMNAYTVGGNPTYGIGIYQALLDWGAKQNTDNKSEWAQSPYVNTHTGLIKLEFTSSDDTVDFSENNTASNNRIIRLYFKCLRTPDEAIGNWAESRTIHFASAADVPEGVTGLAEQQKYYSITSPNGYTASIQSMDLLAPPLSVSTDGVYTQGTGLTAAQVYALPRSYTSTDEQIRKLIENQVKVYNYSNSNGIGSSGRPLDYQTDDILLLTPSNRENGAAKQGDLISVYLAESDTSTRLIGGPTAVTGDGGVAINLGTGNLDPAGGQVYVSVTRAGRESAKVAVPYDAERSRDVYFQVHSSGTPESSNGTAVDRDFTVKRGDQIRLDLYFNHFDDLLAYTFNLSFNEQIVQASDRDFHILVSDGYISEKAVNEKRSCLAVGKDMSGITVHDELIYTTWQSYQNGEKTQQDVEDLMSALEISGWDELEQRYHDICVKYSFGDASQWHGGLLFTGPVREAESNSTEDPGRSEDTLYPYVNNGTGTLRIASATLVNPPLMLERDGEGYHFLSVYFVAVGSGKPSFTISGASGTRDANGTEVVRPNEKTDVILSGPGESYGSTSAATVCAMPFTAHWQTYSMTEVQKTARIQLYDGNALAEDNDSTALYLYPGFAFRDPGFVLQTEDDVVVVNTATGVYQKTISRYIEDEAGKKTTLPDWSDQEAITDIFVIPEGKTSAAYDLKYEYAYEDSAGTQKTVSAVRKVYVIYMRGDLNGDGAISLFDEQWREDGTVVEDPLYQSKTYVDDQSKLHTHLMGGEQILSEYQMPVAEGPKPEGEGSSAADAFRLYMEFYSPTGTKLDPLALPVGSDVILTIRGKNLSALETNGILNFGVRFSYDPAHFALNQFESGDGVLSRWNEDAETLNSTWIESSLSSYQMYTADASGRQQGETGQEVYIQYINPLGEGYSIFTENGDDLCLAAFSLKINNAFEQADDVCFRWLDYALTTEEGTEYSRSALLNGITPFQKPQDTLTASKVSETVGYTITGEVVSYNAKNPVTYELYKMGGDGEYETTPSYTGTAVEAVTEGQTCGQHQQWFGISNIANGTYRIVLKKECHLTYTISNVTVNGNNLDLRIKESLNPITLLAGDVTGDGVIESADQSLVVDIGNYFKDNAVAVNPETDIDGDGITESTDQSILLSNYFISSGDMVFDFNKIM